MKDELDLYSGGVSVTDLTKTYPGPVTALDRVSLLIEPGENVCVSGPSGSGKSTLLHLMGALDQPTSGTVNVDGHVISNLTDRRISALRGHRIGFVFQRFYLTAGVPAIDNVADGLLYTGIPLRHRRYRAKAALQQVGLAERIDHRPHELSGGEQQRVAIARALVRQPALLLADEPTGNLDSASGLAVMDILHALNVHGTTLIVVTHDSNIASRFGRQIHMSDGKIVADCRNSGDI